jgi:hypothetical protein
VKTKSNVILNRIGLVVFVIGLGGCSTWQVFHRGFPWFQGVGIALVIIGAIMGNMTIHNSKPSDWQSYSPAERDAWFQRSLQSLSTQQPVITRLILTNLLVRDMNLPLGNAKSFVDDYCHRNARQIPLSDSNPNDRNA